MCNQPDDAMKQYLLRLTLLVALGILAACSSPPSNRFQGYVEGEYVHIASPLGGTLETLSVSRGDRVVRNAPLFQLESAFEQAAVNEARYGLQSAQDTLANLEKGQRPSEIASIQARLSQAKASSALAKIEYERRVKLISEMTISQEELDRAESDYDQKRQRVREIMAELTTARLGARSDEIRAAAAQVMQAEAKLEQAQWNLHQKTQAAPAPALVFDTLYRAGEWVAAGRPIVSLLPATNVEIRFYVPEHLVGSLQKGQSAQVIIDGVSTPVATTITYISPAAEYTPPVIYSSVSRAKLVFMVKSKPSLDDAAKLHPGQPVDVVLPDLAP